MGFFDLDKQENSDTKTGFFDTPETQQTPRVNNVAEKEATSLFERFKDKINTPTGQAIKSGITSVVAPKINAVKQVFNLPKFINPILEKPRNIEQNKVEAYKKASDLGIVPPVQQNVDQNFEYRKSLEEKIGKTASTDIGVGISQGTRGTRIVAPYAAAYNYLSGKESGDYLDVYNKTIENIDRKMQDPNNSFGENFLFSFADSVPQTLVGSALSLIPVLGKPLSTAFFGLVSAESQMRETGKVSAPNVLIDTAGDRILGANIEKLLATPTQELIKSGMWGYVKRQGKQGLVEGVTEPSQTILKYVSDYKDAKTPEQKQAILTEAKDYVLKGGLLMESLVGFSAGFLISGGVESLNTQQKKKMEETIKNIHPDKDGDFTDPQNKVRKAFRQQVLYALTKNNWNTEKASQEISNDTGINIEVAQKMISELSQNSEFLFSIMKDTADQFINPQENTYKAQLEEIAQEVSPQFNLKKAPETTTEDALMEEAKKYGSAEEFANSLTVEKNEVTSIKTELPTNILETNGPLWDFKPSNQKITDPILVVYDKSKGTYTVVDGHHRYSQALVNKQETIPTRLVFKDSDGNIDKFTKSQLTEIYNKATGKESSQVQNNFKKAVDTIIRDLSDNQANLYTDYIDTSQRIANGYISSEIGNKRLGEIKQEFLDSLTDGQRKIFDNNYKSINNNIYGKNNQKSLGNIGYDRGSSQGAKTTERSSMESMGTDRGNQIFAGKISENYRADQASSESDIRYIQNLINGDLVAIKNETFDLLEAGGFPKILVNKIRMAFEKGGVKNISIREWILDSDEKVYIEGMFSSSENALYLNPALTNLPTYIDGSIIDHEINGHSWYFKLSSQGRTDFYEDLKTKREIVKKAWKDTKSDYIFYWDRTVDQISKDIEKNSNRFIADEILNFIGIRENTNIDLDTFVDRTLAIDKTIEIINTELTRRGYSPIVLTAADTQAVAEHNSLIAENANNIQVEGNSIVDEYISNIKNNSIQFGKQSVQILVQQGLKKSNQGIQQFDEDGEPIIQLDEDITEEPIQKNPPVATAQEALTAVEKRVGVKATDIPKLKNKLNRVEMSLRSAQANPEAHKKAYGKDKIPEYLEEIADTEDKINQIEKATTPKVRSIAKSKIKLSPELEQKQNTLDNLSMQIEMSEEFLKEHPGRNLVKFLSKKEGTFIDMENPYEDALGNKRTEAEKNRILERNKRIQNAAQVAFSESSQGQLGDKFDSSDAVREQIEDYKLAQQNIKNLKEQRKDLRKEFYAERNLYYLEERDRYVLDNFISKQERLNVLDEVAKILRKEGRARMDQVKDIQEYFMLDDAEMSKIMKGKPDLRLLSDAEYENVLKAIQGQAYAEMAHREALFAVRNTIHEMDLKKVENLREAMKMKEFKNMTVNELNQFNDLLQTFQKGDIFLGKRQIQTAGLTDLGDIKTHREVLEKLVKESGLPIETIKNIQVKEVDKFLYDTALARKNPLYKIMVDNYQMEQAKSAIRLGEIRNKTNELFKKARLSRPRRLVDKLVPTDEVIFRYLESTPTDQKAMQKNMTTAEIAAATYVQQQYEYIRDYLVKQGTLKNYRESYVTHIRRSLLESIKEHGGNIFKGGLKQIVKEVLDANKQELQYFNILKDETGNILPLEKFFKFSMRRTDNLVPSKNVAKAFMSYMETFEKKRALDSFVPKIDIFVHVLTPEKETEKGLIQEGDTIKKFVRKWLNTKRGRPIDTGVISPGDKIDTGIRSIISTLRIMQLGLNIPTGLGSFAGAHMATYYGTGSKKFVLGTARSYSKKGKEIAEKYEKILGERILKRLQDASLDIGDKGNALMFGFFSEADRKAKTVFLLGNMTKEEFQKGELSDARLKEIFTEMSEFHKMDNFESVIGKTAIGKIFTTYKGWAVPLFHTTIRNMEKTVSEIKKGNNPVKTKEGRQMLRFTIMNTLLLLLTYGVYRELRDKEDRTFSQQVAYKALNDAYSLLGAMDPTFWTNSGALVGFIGDLMVNLSTIAQSIALDDKTASGEIKGLKKLKKQVTPQLLKQFTKETPEDKLDISIMTSVTKAQKELDALDDDIAEAGIKAWEEVKDLPKGDQKRREIVNALNDLEFEALKKARSADEQYQQELYKKVVPIVDKVEEVGKTEETRDMVNKLTDEEWEAYKKAKKVLYGVDIDVPEAKVLKEGEKQFGPSTDREVYDKQNIITKIWNGAQALGTDPIDFFDALIHGGYEFMGTKGGQLIIARMKEEDSEAIKKAGGVTSSNESEWRLDHIVPLTAGGLNKRSNLQLIPTSQWSSNTALEVAIGRALYEKKINGREAREYIIRYKAGKGQKLSQETLKEYKKKYKSQPLTEEQVLELIAK